MPQLRPGTAKYKNKRQDTMEGASGLPHKLISQLGGVHLAITH